MREIIRLIEHAGGKVAIDDLRFQFHLSVEPDLVPGKSFAEQTRTISHAGRRGDAGEGNGAIYTTTNLIYWASQLAYEIPRRRYRRDFPHYVYLVFVRDGRPGSLWAAHQDINPPEDVIVLTRLGETDPDPDGEKSDYGRMIWKAEKWVQEHHAAVIKQFGD